MKRVNRTLLLVLAVLALTTVSVVTPADACCPAPPSGRPVVNADQTVILVWDANKKMEHFVRRASFKSDADDFGFLVPTPSKPELAEAGDGAFPALAKITAPEIIKRPAPSAGCGSCARLGVKSAPAPAAQSVTVLEEKTVAGFHASVLEAKSSGDLVAWLKEHGYAFSPEVEAWAKPYVDGGWKITALQVAKTDKAEARVAAGSLRISFATEAPLFPYREPASTAAAKKLGASDRLLRIYLLSDTKMEGRLAKTSPWPTSEVAWAGKVAPEKRGELVAQLGIDAATTPDSWYLTEFEDHWPYADAPGDLYFGKSANQADVRRPPTIEYTSSRTGDGSVPVMFAVVIPLAWRLRRRAARR